MAKEKLCGIYCIESLIDGKKYIGLSKNIEKRFYSHKNKLKNKNHPNDHLQSAYKKYGLDNFKFYIIEICDVSELQIKEIYYISKFNTLDNKIGYNQTSGGEGTQDKTDYVLNKMSIKRTKNSVCQFTLDGILINKYRNCRFASKYCNISAENIRMVCDKKYGRKTLGGFLWMYEDDYIKNGIDTSDYTRGSKNKKVIQTDLDGNYIATFISAREAEKITGIGYRMISRVCINQRKHTHGYVFKFES